MKNTLLILLFVSSYVYNQEQIDWNNVMGLSGTNFKTVSQTAENYFKTHVEENEEQSEGNPLSIENYSRWKNFWQYRVGDGTVQNAGVFNPQIQALSTPPCGSPWNSNWKCLGPDGTQITTANLGIVTQLTFDPDDPNTLYMGTLISGVWMTHHAQNSFPDWQCLQDQNGNPGMGVSNILVLPNGGGTHKRVFVGTSPNYGIGVMESADGGLNWNLMAGLNLGTQPVLQLVIEPGSTPNFMYVVTPQNLIKVDLNSGPNYTTTNLFSFTSTNCVCFYPGGYWNLRKAILDPTNNNILYYTTNGFDETGQVYPNCTNTGMRLVKLNITTLASTDITPQIVAGQFDIDNIAINSTTTAGHNLIIAYHRKNIGNIYTQIYNGTTLLAPVVGNSLPSYYGDLQNKTSNSWQQPKELILKSGLTKTDTYLNHLLETR